MNKLYVTLLLIIISCSSCRKIGICKDEDLTLTTIEFAGNQLRTDGFYFGNPDTAWNNIVRYETIVFYKNGILLRTGWKEYDKMEIGIESLSQTSLPQQSKDVWGIIKITGNIIQIEHWLPGQCGYPVMLRTGEILNDTTFVFTKTETRDSEGTVQSDINQTFYFRHFSSKPDSTNNFIK